MNIDQSKQMKLQLFDREFDRDHNNFINFVKFVPYDAIKYYFANYLPTKEKDLIQIPEIYCPDVSNISFKLDCNVEVPQSEEFSKINFDYFGSKDGQQLPVDKYGGYILDQDSQIDNMQSLPTRPTDYPS
jgi:hypothetical protein